MAPSGNLALKSFQSYMINDGLLAKVVEAVKAGEKEARSTGDIQTFEVFYKGFRQNIAIGRVMVIPAKVADSRENFPIALLYGTLIREFGGEEMADLLNYKIGDSEFDEYSKADLAAIKDKVFKNSEGKYESLVMFAPSWTNRREFVTFKFTKDDEKLANMVRHLIFSAYFDPALSSAFNALMTDTSTDKLDVCNVTPKLNFPGIAENPLKDYPDMQKMGAGRKKIFLTKKTADAIEKSQIEPAEMDVFEALNQAVEKGLGVTEPIADVAKHQAADGPGPSVPYDKAQHPANCPCGCKDMNEKTACGELPIVEGTNVGPGTVAAEQEPPKPAKDLAGPEGVAPIGIELKTDGTPIHEEKGKQAGLVCPKCNTQLSQNPTKPGEVATYHCPKCDVKQAAATGTAMAPQKEEIVLYNQQGGSDKEYRVVMTPAGKDQWTVEAFNGRRGKATTKAKSFGPLPYQAAKAKFDEIANDKISGGYTRSVEEQHPEQQSMEPLPDRSAGMTIQFANPIQVALFKGELLGQMSDGKWENSGPRDHWRPMADAKVRVGKPGINFTPLRTYDLSSPELLDIVGDRMLFLAKAAKAYPNVDMGEISHAVQYFENPRKMEDLKDDWQKKYVETILKATGETDLEQFIAKVNGQAYGMGDLRKDLRAMKGVINEPFRQRMASLMKQARDRNETMSYNGHTYRLTIWDERDRLNINLTDECCQKDILDLWDDNAREMIEDGFIDPRKMIQSAIQYADSVGLIDMEEATAGPSMTEASSEASRTAAQKHEAVLAKKYAGRKIAEEQVPTADNILDEVLSDIGQAPIVKIPGDGEAATTPEAQNVPEPMKSEEPEQAKEQSAPEQEAAPFESKEAGVNTGKPCEHGYTQHCKTCESCGFYDAENAPGLYVKYGFQPIEQPEPSDQDLSEAGLSREELEEEGGDFWNDVYFFQHPSGLVGTYSQDEGNWTLTKGMHGKALAQGSLSDGSLAKALAKIPTLRLPGKKKKGSTQIADIMDLMEGSGRLGFGSRYGSTVAEDIAQAKGEVDFNKAEMADNKDADKTVNPEHFAAVEPTGARKQINDVAESKTAYVPMGNVPDAPCPKCGQPIGPDEMTTNETPGGLEAHISCPDKAVAQTANKKADDQRKDDVPVVAEGKPSESAKQPVSDLSACAPEAHEVPPQVDSKTADADLTAPAGVEGMKFYQEPNGDYLVVNLGTASYYNDLGRKGDLEGRAPGIAGNINSITTTGIGPRFLATCKEVSREQVPDEWTQALMGYEEVDEQAMMEGMSGDVDPLANEPGYREHSNSSAAQQGVSKDFWKE